MTRMRWIVPVSVLCVVILAMWVGRPIVDFGAGASGSVVDETGVPLSGVTVRFQSARPVYSALRVVSAARTVTDEGGRFYLSFLSCGRPAGDYRVSFHKD